VAQAGGANTCLLLFGLLEFQNTINRSLHYRWQNRRIDNFGPKILHYMRSRLRHGIIPELVWAIITDSTRQEICAIDPTTGWTALHYVVCYKRTSILEIILSRATHNKVNS
jgi:hypothetical protein